MTRPTVSRHRAPYYMVGCLLLAGAFLSAQMLTYGNPVQWASLAILPVTLWCAYRWRQVSHRVKISQVICDRLNRLPGDFVVMHNLAVPAPWGTTLVDHVIVSRFGVVVAADGPATRWMMEQVEAVRSLLFSRSLTSVHLPVRPLVLIAPGSANVGSVELGTPIVRVDHVRLAHLAPSSEPLLSPAQVTAIAGHLIHL